ncbi:SGNH/GDSL hydrolase family protein [Nocardia bovistercoris]|uniref:SGNH/GDSL hydrolase family protein n=1 Tax=Nocardia bovistercoris TaxID=2785916 RepID=A0A931N6X5_9NOCA|nr:SGNH/GDSL hydrolase family protein [Nocardia bovistercoris]MBH0781444.1 SGNH/GDSL hydrolase family protein [Nocardia bovistercoris]
MRSATYGVGTWLRALCAAAVAITASALGTTAAQADSEPEGKQVVVLGDSFTANGWDPLTLGDVCVRGGTAWPAQLGRLLGPNGSEQIADPSCSGATIDSGPGYTLAMQVLQAKSDGAFGSATRLVTLQLGLDDHWGESDQTLWYALQQCVFDLIRGCGLDAVEQGRIPDLYGVTGPAYADRVRAAVTYIRYYAPAAHVVILGYPEVLPAGQETACVSILGVAPYIQPRGRAIVEYFDRMDAAQRAAAAILGVEFFDARALTVGHGLCSAEPWINGVFDPHTDIIGLPLHPSSRGDAVLANALYDRYLR